MSIPTRPLPIDFRRAERLTERFRLDLEQDITYRAIALIKSMREHDVHPDVARGRLAEALAVLVGFLGSRGFSDTIDHATRRVYFPQCQPQEPSHAAEAK